MGLTMDHIIWIFKAMYEEFTPLPQRRLLELHNIRATDRFSVDGDYVFESWFRIDLNVATPLGLIIGHEIDGTPRSMGHYVGQYVLGANAVVRVLHTRTGYQLEAFL